MKILFGVLLVVFISICPCMASKYGVYMPQDYSYNPDEGERILFIIDLSNSMNETLERDSKYNLMVRTMKEILSQIDSKTEIGLRIYGHRMGFTPIEACRASTLAVPISSDNSFAIAGSLLRYKPRGMTPITYSLKQAIRNDFIGFNGKKHIILLTDGGENCDESPCKFVMEMIKVRRDVQIDVIAFNINDRNDLEQLQCTALVTSGKFYNAQTSAQLYKGFNNSLNRVKNVEAKIILPAMK